MRTRAIPERLRGVFTTRRYTNTRLPLRLPLPVNVTKALVLRPLLEDRGRITESVRILVTVDRMKEKCFQITTKRVRRSQRFQLGRRLFHARSPSTAVSTLPAADRCFMHLSTLFTFLMPIVV